MYVHGATGVMSMLGALGPLIRTEQSSARRASQQPAADSAACAAEPKTLAGLQVLSYTLTNYHSCRQEHAVAITHNATRASDSAAPGESGWH